MMQFFTENGQNMHRVVELLIGYDIRKYGNAIKQFIEGLDL